MSVTPQKVSSVWIIVCFITNSFLTHRFLAYIYFHQPYIGHVKVHVFKTLESVNLGISYSHMLGW